ncbi:MAG TPA: mechanosensitive ion channel family protein [Verrucomicrobiae bacterium]|jgi:small-conductance mechanosensitive channel|nr:mechanosensitive ion channel family protein [Verrucomicrobiae bacterium]
MMHDMWKVIFDLTDPKTRTGVFFLDLTDPGTLVGAGFYGLFALVAAWLIARGVKVGIHRYLDRLERAGADATGIRFLGKLASLGIYLATFVFYAHVIPGLRTLGTSMLASLGVASVVVGLAAQSTLGNLIAGISLVIYRPFKVGDRVQVSAPTGLETGIVLNIDLGYTLLRTADQRLLVIPNSSIASQASLNLSLTQPRTPCGVSLYVATGSDAARARQILLEVAKAQTKIAQVDGCYVTRVTSRGIILTLAASCADADAVPGVKSNLLENAKKQFDAAGIHLV